MDKRKIIAVDLDGTLTKVGYFPDLWVMTFTELYESYEKVEPNKEIIAEVNRLYDAGYLIYIFTSRIDLYQQQTKKWLEKNGVKYHFFICNKPFYDYLIDDKAIMPEAIYKIT